MKRTLILTCLLAAAFFYNSSNAQVNINVNIGSQPQWGPVGYDRVDYYYLPDIESYYYVPTRQFVYLQSGRWIFASSLPSRYRNYNLYSGYKVVLNGHRPYHHFHNHKVKYKKYKGHHHRQHVLRGNAKGKNYVAYKGGNNRSYQQASYRPSSNKNYSRGNSRSYNPVKHSPSKHKGGNHGKPHGKHKR